MCVFLLGWKLLSPTSCLELPAIVRDTQVLPHSTSSDSQGPAVVLSARPSSSQGTSEVKVIASQGQGFLCRH